MNIIIGFLSRADRICSPLLQVDQILQQRLSPVE